MKLGKVTSNDPIERQALGFHQSIVEQLQGYRSYYKSVHGDEIAMSLLVEEMCKRFMREDRDFQKFFATQKAQAPPAAAQSVARTGART